MVTHVKKASKSKPHARRTRKEAPGADNATGVGALLLLKAFASGCAALTGVEAIANAVPSFRVPRVRRAQHAEVALGHNGGFYVVQFATMILPVLSANTSFGGLPVLLKLLARDNRLPHVFALKADRRVHRHGVLALAVVSAALLVFSGGDTNTLVGMVRHWRPERGSGWRGRALLNGFGAVLTGVATVVVTAGKFAEGAWLVVVLLPLLVAAFVAVRRAYARIGERPGLGRIPEPPHRERSVVLVPVSSLPRLTSEALSAAASVGDEVRAVTVCHPDPEDRAQLHALERAWAEWDPGVPLVRLSCERRSLGRPIAAYVREVSAAEAGHPGDRADPGGRAGAALAAAAAEPARCRRRACRATGDRRGDLSAAVPVVLRPARLRPA